MRRPSILGSIVMVTAIGVAAAGCGSGATTSSPGAAPASEGTTGTPIAVSLGEWTVTPASATAPAGTITFDVSNDGTQVHEFVVVKTDTAADALTVVDNKIDESVLTPVDEIEDIAVGATPTLTVDLDAGHYVLLCNIETHYEQGMRADFDVE